MERKNESSDDEADLFCPALPPKLLEGKSEVPVPVPVPEKKTLIVGPSLPPNYNPADFESTSLIVSENENESEDESIIGPLPSATKDDQRFQGPEMEYRIKKMIADTSKADNKDLVREEWMLELPSGKTNILALGLAPRQFRSKKPQDLGDRSVWTDTPEDKERKEKLQESKKDAPVEYSVAELASKRRDEELSNLVDQYSEKKRGVPLVDLHKSKKAKQEESRPKERKPFTREDDLSVNKFDEAQKETIMKKARQLNDRFSAGNKKFL